uniref:PITH domain-containing protein n=1 Tax=Macrostomum lignano TaxID=282301 RepID=A0A1I8HWM4_9PLAT
MSQLNGADRIDAVYLGWLPIDAEAPALAALDELLNQRLAINRSAAGRLRRHRLQIATGIEGSGGCLRMSEFSNSDPNGGQQRQVLVPFADIDWVGIHPRDSMTFGIVLNGYNEDSNSFMHVHAWQSLTGGAGNFAASLAAAADAVEAQQTQQQQQKPQPNFQKKPSHSQQRQSMPVQDKFCLHKHAAENGGAKIESSQHSD